MAMATLSVVAVVRFDNGVLAHGNGNGEEDAYYGTVMLSWLADSGFDGSSSTGKFISLTSHLI